ncbi:GNAT family N-acetyltransferase [Virgibacillus halodenitrificans]|uniref:GNAT family N-acetyltransferase n=1 Tax=Virgibacillus halodenitrificans TaxID=1482 RepID=UPI000761AD29|nr:GNAT family N-acetyltransferase [Virgibacillus halodenitrificans]MEC2158817.1 GNAT family N-acetyltransferase [Virgibacillus halodenitrificans]
MKVSLVKGTENDAEAIFDIQVKAFTPLLEKYNDYDVNPAKETIDRVVERINRPNGGFYKILVGSEIVGAMCIFWEENVRFWISPMFILPSYQGKGIAQKAMILMEKMFPEATSWELSTILEEARNCYLYEKMGYSQTGVRRIINDNTTLVFYKKSC